MLGNKQITLICLFLAIAALMAFWQVNQCDFINYDDPSYVTENIHIRNGVTTEAIRWAFTTCYAANWHPVTWMSHMLDVQLFGLKPRWHHLTNLLFHIANTLLLFLIFCRMTKAPLKSAFVAALFALHPLHVESVAWVSERKDVLSTFFWMLAMGAYINYVEHRTEDGRRRKEDRRQRTEDGEKWTGMLRYSAVFIFFALGLMAKPMLVTFPFVLLLLDYWPLQRLEPKKSAGQPRTEAGRQGAGSGGQAQLSAKKRKGGSGRMPTGQGMVKEEKPTDRICQWALIRPLILEKIPLFALTALSCIVTYVAQKKGGSVSSFEEMGPGVRIANAFVSYIVYIGKTLWAANLAVYYPHPELWSLWQAMGAALLLIAVTIAVIRSAKRFPYLAVGWLWFTGALVPVIGIVQVGGQAMADRYTYIPLIGLFVMAAWGIPELLQKWRPTRFPTLRKEALFALSGLVLLSLFIVTRTQVGYWRNNIALYDHTLKVASPSEVILCNRGNAYRKLGDLKQAISDYDRAVEINPTCAEAYSNRGNAHGKLGDQSQAISDYDRAIEINPEYADAYGNRGTAYSKLGKYRQAVLDFDRAIEINPELAWVYNGRGMAYGKFGEHNRSISDFDRAIELNPEYAEAYHNRGAVYSLLHNNSQAISDFDRAVQIDPDDAYAYYNRGVVYGELHNQRQAISDYDRAIEIDPENADAYNNRGVAHYGLGDHRQAISDYDRAIEIKPDYAKAHYNRGVVYAELGDGGKAIEDLKAAAKFGSEAAMKYLRSKGINW